MSLYSQLELDQIEINNHSLQDICNALTALANNDAIINANHLQQIIRPLAEFMGELLDSTSNALMNIDKADEGKA